MSNILKTQNIHWKPIIYVVLCTFLTAAGQVFWKMSAASIVDIHSFFFNLPLIAGFVSYGIGTLLLISAFKYGELSTIYPFIALSFVWANIGSIFIFGELISIINWLGIIAILIGISLIGYGSKRVRK
jgi:uncharacterized membrane protein